MTCSLLGVAQAEESMFDRYMDRLDHENTVLVARVSWLLVAESFLLVPYAILSNPSYNLAVHARRRYALLDAHLNAQVLYELIPWLGLLLAVATLVSVGASFLRMSQLRNELNEYAVHVGHFSEAKDLPVLASSRPVHITGISSGLVAPVVCVALWVALLAQEWWVFLVVTAVLVIAGLLMVAESDRRPLKPRAGYWWMAGCETCRSQPATAS